jgi:hypothetical protein
MLELTGEFLRYYAHHRNNRKSSSSSSRSSSRNDGSGENVQFEHKKEEVEGSKDDGDDEADEDVAVMEDVKSHILRVLKHYNRI